MATPLSIEFFPADTDDGSSTDTLIQEVLFRTGVRGRVVVQRCLPSLLPNFGISSLPAVRIGHKVMLQGRLPSERDVLEWFHALVPPAERGPCRLSADRQWPKTVEEAANCIVRGLREDEKARFADASEAELRSLHMTMGQGIRNGFGLWAGNNALLDACGTQEPDDASFVIVQAVQKAVCQERRPLRRQ